MFMDMELTRSRCLTTNRSSPSKLMFTIESVSQLRESLKEIGSDLVVRMGRPAEVLPALATSLSCSNIVTEEELQSSWRNTISSAEEALQVSGIQACDAVCVHETLISFLACCATLVAAF